MNILRANCFEIKTLNSPLSFLLMSNLVFSLLFTFIYDIKFYLSDIQSSCKICLKTCKEFSEENTNIQCCQQNKILFSY